MLTKYFIAPSKFRTSGTLNVFHLLRRKFSSTIDYEHALDKVKSFEGELNVEAKLKLYALYKQATIGNVTFNQPSIFEFEERAKYNAWKALHGVTKDEAERKYAELISSLISERKTINSSKNSISDFKKLSGLKVSVENRVLCITLDRPKKYNALTLEMYNGIIEALNFANRCEEVSATAIFGSGEYYCSGNNIGNFVSISKAKDIESSLSSMASMFENYIKAFINHEKPLLIFVNGPAVGIAVTTLTLADYVLASEKATFHTPFTSLGISPEGCSTYMFPLSMGTLKSAELLIFGKKITAYEALERNLVSQVVPAVSFAEEAKKKLEEVVRLPLNSLKLNKSILMSNYKQALLNANQREITLLKQRWTSNEYMEAMQSFLKRS